MNPLPPKHMLSKEDEKKKRNTSLCRLWAQSASTKPSDGDQWARADVP